MGKRLDFPALAKLCEPLVGMEKGNDAKKVEERIKELAEEELQEPSQEPGAEEEQWLTPESADH